MFISYISISLLLLSQYCDALAPPNKRLIMHMSARPWKIQYRFLTTTTSPMYSSSSTTAVTAITSPINSIAKSRTHPWDDDEVNSRTSREDRYQPERLTALGRTNREDRTDDDKNQGREEEERQGQDRSKIRRKKNSSNKHNTLITSRDYPSSPAFVVGGKTTCDRRDLAELEERDRKEMEWLMKASYDFLQRRLVPPLKSQNETCPASITADVTATATTTTTPPPPPPKPLTLGQFHRARLLMKAWAHRSCQHGGSKAPHAVDQILQQLILEEQQQQQQQQTQNECTTIKNSHKTTIKVGTELYNILLDAWSNSNEPHAAEQCYNILLKMEALYSQGHWHVRPNESSYNACIKAYVKRGGQKVNLNNHTRQQLEDIDKAQALLKRMEETTSPMAESDNLHNHRRLQPNRRGYNLVLYALANSNLDHAAELAEDMLRKMWTAHDRNATHPNVFVRPDTNTYNQVLTCWARGRQAGFERRMMTIFNELLALPRDWKILPNTDTFNGVMSGWLKSTAHEALDQMLTVLDKMEEISESGNICVRPDQVSMNTVMAAFGKCRETRPRLESQVADFLDRFDRRYAIKPDTVSNNILLDIWKRSNQVCDPQRAMKLFESMEQGFRDGNVRVKPDSYTYCTVIDSFIKRGHVDAPKVAQQLLDRMCQLHLESGGDRPCAFVYNTGTNHKLLVETS